MTRHIGIKLSHDAAVAMIDGDRLVFSVELEKRHNNPRYSRAHSWAEVEEVLAAEGVTIRPNDNIVIDGWNNAHIKSPFNLRVAPYHDGDTAGDGAPWGRLLRATSVAVPLQGAMRFCASYPHAAGHVIGAYVMSPFAHDEEPAHVIAFDGGMSPRIYSVDPHGAVDFIDAPLPITGLIYGIMGYYFGPYKRREVIERPGLPPPHEELFGTREWPGKLMSWLTQGAPRDALVALAQRVIEELAREEAKLPMVERLSFRKTGLPEHRLCRALLSAQLNSHYSDEDVLASLHAVLERALVSAARRHIPRGANLIFTGGSALNIKWNSALRDCGHFAAVFVPPCPNDSGSALGAAAAGAWQDVELRALRWSVYAGPHLAPTAAPLAGWRERPCSVADAGRLLARHPEAPLCFLHGRAEIGPRALGHRSLLMAPGAAAKATLNAIKGREPWRPVAPLALERAAQELFNPGTPDPYMLFDHEAHAAAHAECPAVVHLDGSARLQTINVQQCPVVTHLIDAYALHSGRPAVLCNTSANLNGSGFFPDATSAMLWGGAPRIWADGTLYYRDGVEA